MSILSWDNTGERYYETGVKKGVLYPYNTSIAKFSEEETYTIGDYVMYNGEWYKCKTAISTAGAWDASKWDKASAYSKGVAWNGLTNATEAPSGAEESPIYADDIKYLALRSKEELGLTITAYTYPDEWAACDGSTPLIKGATVGQQVRKSFGLCYRTIVGNDIEGDDLGYKLHLIYGCSASPSERAYATVNDAPEAIEFSWEISTIPVDVGEGLKPSACITVDSRDFTTTAEKDALKALEDALYGTASTDPYLPLPAEVKTLLTPAAG